jgi:hypothetical protein
MAKLDDDLAALATMSSAQLQDRWKGVTGTLAPRISAGFLRLALGYEMQAKALGGLSRSTQQRLAQLAAARTETRPAARSSRLIREWNGTAHVVTIGEDGVIRWNDRDWNSLSEVAREITGTRWSGPAFFGLKKRLTA